MTENRLLKLLKASTGEMLSEYDDTDVTWLVWEAKYLTWDDDNQTHCITDKGKEAIHEAVVASAPLKRT